MSRTYQTQSDESRFSNDINVTEVQFLGHRGSPVAPLKRLGTMPRMIIWMICPPIGEIEQGGLC